MTIPEPATTEVLANGAEMMKPTEGLAALVASLARTMKTTSSGQLLTGAYVKTGDMRRYETGTRGAAAVAETETADGLYKVELQITMIYPKERFDTETMSERQRRSGI